MTHVILNVNIQFNTSKIMQLASYTFIHINFFGRIAQTYLTKLKVLNKADHPSTATGSDIFD